MKKIFATLLIAFVGISYSIAQHEVGPSLSSQIFSRINFNPSGIGNSEKINIFSMTRMQWAGFEGKPMTTVLNVHYFNENIKSGFGGSFVYDQLGMHHNSYLNAKFVYAYNLDLAENMLMSFGLSGGINRTGVYYSLAKMNEDFWRPENNSKINPDFDFGVEFSMPNLLVGAAINHIGFIKPKSSLTPMQTYYGYARGLFNITEQILLSPSLLYMNSGQNNVFDLSTVAYLQDFAPGFMFWAGLDWRLGSARNIFGSSALSILAGMEWNFIRFGYGYEMGFGVGNYNSHELTLSFVIPTKSNKPVDPKKRRRR